MSSLRERLQTTLSDYQGRFLQLTPRERAMVATAATAVFVFILFFIFFTLSTGATRIQSRTTSKLLRLKEAQALATSYQMAELARQDTLRKLAANVSLLSFLEDTGKKAGLDIPTMNPKGDIAVGDDGKIIESSVELTLTDIPLSKLLSFLSLVERPPQGFLKVRNLRLEPHPDKEVLTAWATVSSYHLKEGP